MIYFLQFFQHFNKLSKGILILNIYFYCLGQCKVDLRKAEVYSLGIVLFTLITGAFPYDTKTTTDLSSISTVIESLSISSSIKQLLNGMLQLEPNNRISLEDILLNDWLNRVEASVPKE